MSPHRDRGRRQRRGTHQSDDGSDHGWPWRPSSGEPRLPPIRPNHEPRLNMVRPSSESMGTARCSSPTRIGARLSPAASYSSGRGGLRKGLLQAGVVHAPDDVATRHVRPPVVRLAWRSVVVDLPPWEWARARGGRRSAKPSRVISTTPQGKIPSPRTRSRNRDSAQRRAPRAPLGLSGAESGSGNAAADHDDIKDGRGHASAPTVA